MKVALGVEYDGHSYYGWQLQNGQVSVQSALEGSIKRFIGQPARVYCSGRTDRGVHAVMQVVHFNSPVLRQPASWVTGLNAFLNKDIVVRWSRLVSDDFHARYCAISRKYCYILYVSKQRPAILKGKVGWSHVELDVQAVKKSISFLIGEHDFSSFRASSCQAKSAIKTMYTACIRQSGPLIIFEFEANGFLHHMIRNLVGSLIEVGKHTRDFSWIKELLEEKNRCLGAPTFSADGLYYLGPEYEDKWGIPARPETFFSSDFLFPA